LADFRSGLSFRRTANDTDPGQLDLRLLARDREDIADFVGRTLVAERRVIC
jgi:hypothetical protein